MIHTNRIGAARSDKWLYAVNYTFLTVVLIIVLYPLIYIVSSSFSSIEAVVSGRVWLWPVEFSLEGYAAVFKHHLLLNSLKNSLYYMAVGTAINIVITVTSAYALSRKDLFGRNFFMMIFVFTMFFNGGLIPTYILVQKLGILNTPWAIWLPLALIIWNMIIARTYFQTTLPQELLEAAQIDGCNDFLFLRKVVIPLSGPIIAVIALFYGVMHWNQYFNAMIYLRDPQLFPLQLVLREILILSQMEFDMVADADAVAAVVGLGELLKYSLIVVSALPLLIVYPFVQKFFVKGIMIGALKG
ncbi:carbohydrate ABC transporter permease [Cohnella cellulosilytica]|uniref:Carbohydrate ABC transporter permease n=1 Tax=Cohnella cellulosilytica TaxID=986710 RepID=A0ABW2FBJ2_9BACL